MADDLRLEFTTAIEKGSKQSEKSIQQAVSHFKSLHEDNKMKINEVYNELNNESQKMKLRDEFTSIPADTRTRVHERLTASDKQIKDVKVYLTEEIQAWTMRNDNQIEDITTKIDNKIEKQNHLTIAETNHVYQML